jgi:hemolysin D
VTLADRFPTLAHHWRILSTSWSLETEAEKSRRTSSDPEFLPAALEIMETPPSPGLRILMLTLCSLFGLVLWWSCIGKLDVVAVASGKIVPAGSVKLIQPMEIGVVRAIHVRDGQHVRKGQLLVELDPTVSGAEEAQATQGLLTARVDAARNAALLAHLAGRAATFTLPPGTPTSVADVQRQFIRAEIAAYEAKYAGIMEQRAGARAELTSASAEVAKLEQTLPLVEQQLQARRDLTSRGHFSKLRLLEYEQAKIEHERNIDVQRAAVTRARAAIANLDSQLVERRQGFARDAVGDMSKAGDDVSLRSEELRKSAQRRRLQFLRSPVEGTVQQVSVHTIGGVIQPAQILMVIVPLRTQVEVEATILNRDIGFIHLGQEVRVKVEAFPFTEYGMIEGRVVGLNRDAIVDEKLGLVYFVRVRMKSSTLHVGHREMPLNPGMAVQAEIKTGQRRIVQYLLSPISAALDEAGRER